MSEVETLCNVITLLETSKSTTLRVKHVYSYQVYTDYYSAHQKNVNYNVYLIQPILTSHVCNIIGFFTILIF